jgi:lincosamide nucleotidyltransferase B/F
MSTRRRDLLISRLNEIASSLARSEKAVALIGLGSAGLEVERLDDYSDLDFFAVVEAGCKNEFLNSLAWLSSICPIAYCYRNTPDGYKVLFEDGVFGEFAVFEEAELRHIPFAPGRIVWKKASARESLAVPQQVRNSWENPSLEWSLGEALTSLYVGLCRLRRGGSSLQRLRHEMLLCLSAATSNDIRRSPRPCLLFLRGMNEASSRRVRF